jgi:hypothetical protein
MLQGFHEAFLVLTKDIRPITASLLLPFSRPGQWCFMFIKSGTDVNKAVPPVTSEGLYYARNSSVRLSIRFFYLERRPRAYQCAGVALGPGTFGCVAELAPLSRDLGV